MAFPGDADCIDESYIRLRPGEESLAETVAQSAHFEKDRGFSAAPAGHHPVSRVGGHAVTFPSSLGRAQRGVYGALGYDAQKLAELRQQEII